MKKETNELRVFILEQNNGMVLRFAWQLWLGDRAFHVHNENNTSTVILVDLFSGNHNGEDPAGY